MARGRPPKPVELKDAEGNLGRRPLPAPIRTGEGIDDEPPAILAEAGRDLWNELVKRLGPAGVLDQVDRTGLTMLCLQWDRADDAGRVLGEEGHYARGSTGQLVAHPAIAVERSAQQAVMKFLTEYAATPVARARIAAAKAAREQQQEFEEIVDAEPVEIEDADEIDGDVL